ncbi:MAG: hypothetical protein AB7S92_04215 [Parvibaculaceae bacterium]
MTQFIETVTIDGRLFKVTIDAPDGVGVTDIQALAEAALRSVNRRVTIGGATVRVEPA